MAEEEPAETPTDAGPQPEGEEIPAAPEGEAAPLAEGDIPA